MHLRCSTLLSWVAVASWHYESAMIPSSSAVGADLGPGDPIPRLLYTEEVAMPRMSSDDVCRQSEPKVVHCKRAARGGFVYISRPSRFGNSFQLADPTDDRERERVLVRYTEYFQAWIANDLDFRCGRVASRPGSWLRVRPRRCHGGVTLTWLATTHPAEDATAARPRRPRTTRLVSSSGVWSRLLAAPADRADRAVGVW
jgi:hypothetical protein